MIPLLKPFSNIDKAGLDERKRAALEYLLDAWADATDAGVEPEVVASAAIFAAVSDLVDVFGEEKVADMVQDLPDRIRMGEFTIDRVLQ